MIRRGLRLKGARQGNAIIEFALAFGFLFPIFAGTFEFGYAFFVYSLLQNAVREGARYASIKTYDAPTDAYTAGFGSAVKNMVVYGSPDGGARPVVPGLNPANVVLTVTFTGGAPSQVSVRVQNYSLPAVFKTFVLNKPVCTFPYAGRFAPDGI